MTNSTDHETLEVKIIDASCDDGYRVALKGIGYTVDVHSGHESPMYGRAYAKHNKRVIESCLDRFMSRMFGSRSVGGWSALYSQRYGYDMTSDIREAWMESFNAGIEEICRDASY